MSKTFGKNLKTFRALARMTQSDLANAASITRAAVNNYELGRSEPSFENLCRMAAALGVEITDLVGEQEQIPAYVRVMQVTDEESALLQAYRAAESTYQTVALDVLRAHRKGGR